MRHWQTILNPKYVHAKGYRSYIRKRVFKPLEDVDLKDKEKLKIAIIKDRKDVVKLYRGILGKAKVEELEEFEKEPNCRLYHLL